MGMNEIQQTRELALDYPQPTATEPQRHSYELTQALERASSDAKEVYENDIGPEHLLVAADYQIGGINGRKFLGELLDWDTLEERGRKLCPPDDPADNRARKDSYQLTEESKRVRALAEEMG